MTCASVDTECAAFFRCRPCLSRPRRWRCRAIHQEASRVQGRRGRRCWDGWPRQSVTRRPSLCHAATAAVPRRALRSASCNPVPAATPEPPRPSRSSRRRRLCRQTPSGSLDRTSSDDWTEWTVIGERSVEGVVVVERRAWSSVSNFCDVVAYFVRSYLQLICCCCWSSCCNSLSVSSCIST